MTYGQAYRAGIETLLKAGVAEAQIDAFYLLEHVTGISKASYLLKQQEEMPADAQAAYEQLIERRSGHEPCQYIIGSTEFMGLTFTVTPDVLIPRQDTELLAETAIDEISRLTCESLDRKFPERKTRLAEMTVPNAAGDADKAKLLRVLDLCTGSGALAVCIKHFCPQAEVVATDLSEAALDVAKSNALHNEANIDFRQGDLLAPVGKERFSVIVSNPPYVTEEEYADLMPEVKEFEPKLALTAGDDGLDCYRRIAAEAPAHLKEDGVLLLEIGCFQAAAVTALLKENDFVQIRVLQDLNGRDRVVAAKRPASFSDNLQPE